MGGEGREGGRGKWEGRGGRRGGGVKHNNYTLYLFLLKD